MTSCSVVSLLSCLICVLLSRYIPSRYKCSSDSFWDQNRSSEGTYLFSFQFCQIERCRGDSIVEILLPGIEIFSSVHIVISFFYFGRWQSSTKGVKLLRCVHLKSHKVNRRNLRQVVRAVQLGLPRVTESDNIYWFKTGTN